MVGTAILQHTINAFITSVDNYFSCTMHIFINSCSGLWYCTHKDHHGDKHDKHYY